MSNPWNENEPFDYSVLWLGTKTVLRHINRQISASEDIDWLNYVLSRYIVRDDRRKRCLILGAGEGNVERRLRAGGFHGPITSSDIAGNALGRAKEQSHLLGYTDIEYRIADLNTDRFDGPFNYIIAEGVLHHIEDLGAC